MGYDTNIWHPCTQMKDFEKVPPQNISKTHGSYIYTEDGKKLFDATSSWWCKSLGHRHPDIISNLKKQLDYFEHTIFANTTNRQIKQFSKKICDLTGFDKTLYASDGSCAVEIAIKMTIHLRKLKNQNNKTKFVCLENAYHGETLATMSVSDCGLYSEPYRDLLFDNITIKNIPYVNGKEDLLWSDAKSYWVNTKKYLEKHKENINALIVEPLCQGAGGMLIYSKDYLQKLCEWCKDNDIYIIFDEIMTGVGRLGKLFAFEYLNLSPDFLCISKGVTSGVIPFSITLTKDKFYNMFYKDKVSEAFLHSHTHSGNVLGAVAANVVLESFEKYQILSNVSILESRMLEAFQRINKEIPVLKNIRNLGCIIAADLDTKVDRLGFEVYKKALNHGVLIRPLGNTIYWFPPLNSTAEDIDNLEEATKRSIMEAFNI